MPSPLHSAPRAAASSSSGTPAPVEPPHRYSSDRPVEALKDDKLERESFAERLAADIAGWHGNDSLVMSLNGEWGSGKSTLKNFIKEKLQVNRKPIVVEFNPWAWSGQEKLVEGFFGALRAQFRKTDLTAETQRMVERWEALETWTKLGAEISENIPKALAVLGGGSVTVTLLTNTSSEAWIRNGGIVLGVAGVVATAFFAIFPGLAARMIEYARIKAGKARLSLEELRAEITKQLQGLRREHGPVVVIIDDIDRLNAEEIRLLFQLVKVNADFPNLVYLLLFQTNIVTRALNDVAVDNGAEYLKKIVQVPVEVPQASRALMQQMFTKSLDEILRGQNAKIRWERQRYLDVFEDHVWPYFRTLRDIKRFLGTFDFYYHGQIQEGTLQVNPLDLLIIEVLRTFDHEVYLDVRDSLGFNLPKKFMQLLFADKQRKEEITVEIDAIVERRGKTPAHKAHLKAILRTLFPEGLTGEDRSNAERDLRVCHPEHFPKYFQHGSDSRATSAANLNRLLGTVHDRQQLSDRFRALIRSKEVEAVFAKLGLYFDDIPESAAAPFIGALFDVADELPEASVGYFNQDAYRLAGRMAYFTLKKLPDSASRVRVFSECLASSRGVTAPAIAMGMLEAAAEHKEDEAPIPAAELATVRTQTLERIREYARSGAIWQSEHLGLFLYRWRDWGSQEEVNAWVAQELITPSKKAAFVAKMMSHSIINGSRVEYYLDGAALEKFVALEPLAADLAGVPDDQLTKPQLLGRKLLQRAVRLKAAGHGYSEVRERGDFDPEPASDD